MKTKIENHVKDKLCEIEEVLNVANSAEFQLNPIRGNIYLNILSYRESLSCVKVCWSQWKKNPA
jgi:hypothetical protein